MKKYLPLIWVEGYLLTTLALLYIGPIKFRLHNEGAFITLMFLYHLFFIFGYLIGAQFRVVLKTAMIKERKCEFYYTSFAIGIICIFGSYKNLTLSSAFIPYDLFSDLSDGLTQPGSVYTERMSKISSGVTSDLRVFNIASIFFAFFKLLFIFKFIYFWRALGNLQRLMALAYSFLFVSVGISAGINSVVFIFFIFSISSIIVTLYVRRYTKLVHVIAALAVLLLVPISYFGYLMSQRGGAFENFANSSPLGDISISTTFTLSENYNVVDFLIYTFVWFDNYLVQGYYGFSLILNLDHSWTFGFGSSAFLQNQYLNLTGIDISNYTFQSKISNYWDQSAQWHSFYGQFANDFGFIGLTGFMFILGFYLSKIWNSVIYKNSFYGAALIPIFILMFIFFPANNQVFGYIDTFSYFIFVSLLWGFEIQNVRIGGGALNRSTPYERLSRPKGPRGVSDEAFEQEASPTRGGGREVQAG